jgi:UDP-N-acetylmuramate dehydrogenase
VTLAALSIALGRLGWSGLEAACGIPGSVGAAVLTNAGAHGWEMRDSLAWAEVETPEGARRLAPAELGLDYRTSALKGRRDVLLTRAGLNVRRERLDVIAARIAEFQEHRRRTQPNSPSVGSMFKNPPGDFAGRLIEHVGLKGAREGGATISEVHANFFVNKGGASAADVLALVAEARRKVGARYGIRLELEIEPLEEGAVRAP